ncbi:MAG: phosphoribosylanthranilate isomerase [Thermodesulfobacteriota bacterium]
MVKRTRIKICGMTEQADVKRAVAAGVDALGFIFAEKSPRRIEPDKARDLIRTVPPFVDTVGVFVNADPDLVTDIIKYCGLTMVQLHGDEQVDYCELMPVRVLKSFAVGKDEVTPKIERYENAVQGYLLDTYHEKMAGGTGQPFDWKIVESLNIPGPVYLAGGIGPETVEEAIKIVRPFAVDVNSGVEIEPGKKDHDKIAAVVEAVRRADQV